MEKKMRQKIQKHAMSLKKQPLGGVSKTVDKVKSEFKNIANNHSALKISQQRIEDEENKGNSRVSEFAPDLSNQSQN